MVGYAMNQTIVALSYTKNRTMFGMVGIEVDMGQQIGYVRLAKQWSRNDMNKIPAAVKQLHDKIQWDLTFADQLVGQHLLRKIEAALDFSIEPITTQKNLKDPEDIEMVKVMDMTEMTQLTLSLKQNHQIQFPKQNQTKDMKFLVKQLEMFTEYVTEQGTVTYYAPGEELDCLPRALMICLFAGRMAMQGTAIPLIIKQGSTQPKSVKDSEEEFLRKIFGDFNDSLGTNHISKKARDRIFAAKYGI
jgi:hypothetical protein